MYGYSYKVLWTGAVLFRMAASPDLLLAVALCLLHAQPFESHPTLAFFKGDAGYLDSVMETLSRTLPSVSVAIPFQCLVRALASVVYAVCSVQPRLACALSC